VEISGEGKVYGPAVALNPGTITGAYNFGEEDKNNKK
jgi:hypothetical protein